MRGEGLDALEQLRYPVHHAFTTLFLALQSLHHGFLNVKTREHFIFRERQLNFSFSFGNY